MIVISANRGPQRSPKNWRVFEQDAVEKHFGKVVNVNGEDGFSVLEKYEKYGDRVGWIRWYPDPEEMTTIEYEGMVNQSDQIGDVPYLVTSAKGFINVQCKDEAFKAWQDAGVNCPKFFTFTSSVDFATKRDTADFSYPFLVRLNDSVSGNHSYRVNNVSEIRPALDKLFRDFEGAKGGRISTKMMCIELLDTVDRERDVNLSFRIHVAGNSVISGYARVVPSNNWVAITAGSFKIENADQWLYYNIECERICRENEQEICNAVHALGCNMQGIDVVIDQNTGKLSFLEVQPTYAAGYPQDGPLAGWYRPPYYNPSDPSLVQFLKQNQEAFIKDIPMYYSNWLNKENHFDMMYGSLRKYLDDVRS